MHFIHAKPSSARANDPCADVTMQSLYILVKVCPAFAAAPSDAAIALAGAPTERLLHHAPLRIFRTATLLFKCCTNVLDRNMNIATLIFRKESLSSQTTYFRGNLRPCPRVFERFSEPQGPDNTFVNPLIVFHYPILPFTYSVQRYSLL